MIPKRVLVVDDEPFIRELVKVKLGFCGIETIEGSNGFEGLEQAEREKPDLILLDVMMPKMDGFETCQRLKENPQTRDIPVIMLSARGERTAQEKGERLGIIDYLTKPFSPQALAERILEILNRNG
ncbi:MAG TPA: response regulator [Nitrospiria bacterium]|nr:response regulator [Nitrospiria bacterium]